MLRDYQKAAGTNKIFAKMRGNGIRFLVSIRGYGLFSLREGATQELIWMLRSKYFEEMFDTWLDNIKNNIDTHQATLRAQYRRKKYERQKREQGKELCDEKEKPKRRTGRPKKTSTVDSVTPS